MATLTPEHLTSIELISDGRGGEPAVVINSDRVVDYMTLPVSRRALVSVAVWLSVAGDPGHSTDDTLVAGLRAAALLGFEVPAGVRINVRLLDAVTGRQLSFDVDRCTVAPETEG